MPGVTRNLFHLSSAVTDEEGHPLENERTIFQAREEGPRHHQHEDVLRYVQQDPDDISWTVDQDEFDDLLVLKKDSTPSPDGIPHGAYRCAGGLGSKFLFNAYKAVLEGSAIPECFAESRTVFTPKTTDIDDHGRIIRSPDALRPLTLCNCDCKLLTSAVCRGLHWYTMRCIHTSQRCISSRQMTDNIFEIETTALAHVACAPQESGVLLTDFAAAFPSVNHSLDLLCDREHWFACLSLSLPTKYLHRDSITHVEFAGAERGQFLMARGVRQGCPASGFPFCNGL